MKPVVERRLARFVPEIVSSFETLARRARKQLEYPHLSESQVNKMRLAILNQFQNPRSQKDIDRAHQRLLDCPQLLEQANKNWDQIHEAGWEASLIDLMSIPYVAVPPIEWAVIALCLDNSIPIEKGHTDFSEICYLMLEELNDNRAADSEGRKAFRFKVISQYSTILLRRGLSSGHHHMDIRKAYSAKRRHYLSDTRRAVPKPKK